MALNGDKPVAYRIEMNGDIEIIKRFSYFVHMKHDKNTITDDASLHTVTVRADHR